MADPKLFPKRAYPDGHFWGPFDEDCEEREILNPGHVPVCGGGGSLVEIFRMVVGSGERRIVIDDFEGDFCLSIQLWDVSSCGHIVESFNFQSEREAIEKVCELVPGFSYRDYELRNALDIIDRIHMRDVDGYGGYPPDVSTQIPGWVVIAGVNHDGEPSLSHFKVKDLLKVYRKARRELDRGEYDDIEEAFCESGFYDL